MTRKSFELEKNQILLSAESSSAVIANLYHAEKRRNKTLTMKKVSQRIGISSTGYFSDVIHSKRHIAKKYLFKTALAFGLNRTQKRVFYLIAEYERAKPGLPKKKQKADLSRARKDLCQEYLNCHTDAATLFEAIEIFCAFGLFKNRPTLEQLLALYGSSSVENSMALLTAMGVVVEKGEGFELTGRFLNFSRSSKGASPVELFKHSVRVALDHVDQWFSHQDMSYFESFVISVQSSEYQKSLKAFRDFFGKMHNRLESNHADMVACLNVQVFPKLVGRNRRQQKLE